MVWQPHLAGSQPVAYPQRRARTRWRSTLAPLVCDDEIIDPNSSFAGTKKAGKWTTATKMLFLRFKVTSKLTYKQHFSFAGDRLLLVTKYISNVQYHAKARDHSFVYSISNEISHSVLILFPVTGNHAGNIFHRRLQKSLHHYIHHHIYQYLSTLSFQNSTTTLNLPNFQSTNKFQLCPPNKSCQQTC